MPAAVREQSGRLAPLAPTSADEKGRMGQGPFPGGEYLGKLCLYALKRFLRDQPIVIVHPFGREVCSQISNEKMIEMRFQNFKAITRVVLNPYLEIGEQYVNGHLDIDEDDLEALLRIFVRKGRLFERSRLMGKVSFAWRRKVFVWKQKHSEALSRLFVQKHYDTPPEVFASFLDSNMVYTCADFECGASTLEQAQTDKFRNTVKRLGVVPGDKVLEIGCGWGSLGAYLASSCGANVTGLTISPEQKSYADKRYENLGGLNILDEDYRSHKVNDPETYDRVVSVGMLEHVGFCQLSEYFACVSHQLKSGGTALVHTIARDNVGVTNSWIDRYIFPGGYMASWDEIINAAKKSGLDLVDATHVYAARNYVKTLEAWVSNFKSKKANVAFFSESEKNTRVYFFYFGASIAAFHELDMKATQFVFVKNRLRPYKLL